MSMLLIGGDSYLGRSISAHIKSEGGTVTSFSSKAIYSNYSYEQFDPNILALHDFAVVVATPGHNGTANGLRINSDIFRNLFESGLNVYALSTIHTLNEDNLSEYVTLNREFEKIALTYNFRVLRVPNFIGYVPTGNESQSLLLPWSLLKNFQKNGILEINSNLDSEFEWVTSADLIHCFLTLQQNPIPSIVEIQPGYKCQLRDIVKYFTDFAATNFDFSIQVKVNNSEFYRKTLSGPNPVGHLGWKSELTDKILQSYVLEYLDKNWSKHE